MAGSGGSPLMIAARTGAADAVRILLDAGATVDALAKPSEGFVQEIAGLHAQDDATLDETTAEAKRQRLDAFFEEGSTALMYAAALGHREIVSMLVAAGASARLKDKDGQSPLVHAANMGAVAIADELITKANADPNDTTGTGVPLLINAIASVAVRDWARLEHRTCARCVARPRISHPASAPLLRRSPPAPRRSPIC